MLTYSHFQDITTIFLSIIAEAIPFILLGVLVSTLLKHYVSTEKILKILPQNFFASHLLATMIGFIFPVCECGNIPVARRLIQKNIHPSLAITFLLAAPALNPVVILATFAAFRFNPEIVYFRILFTFLIAFIMGILFSFHPKAEEMVSKDTSQEKLTCHGHEKPNPKALLSFFFKDMVVEFFEMLAVLIQGALLAAFIQIIIPREILFSLGKDPVASVFAMMLLAFIISVCANVDAFIALSYSNIFTPGALLAFLTFGPMIDLKTIFLLKKIFRPKIIIFIALGVFLLTTFLTLLFNLFFA